MNPTPDTPPNPEGQALAKRLFAAYPPELMLFGLIEAALGNSPTEKEVEGLMTRLEEPAVGQELAAICESALLSTFTTAELKFLVDFYDSDMGRTVLPKMGAFSTTATPGVMRLLGRLMSGLQ